MVRYEPPLSSCEFWLWRSAVRIWFRWFYHHWLHHNTSISLLTYSNCWSLTLHDNYNYNCSYNCKCNYNYHFVALYIHYTTRHDTTLHYTNYTTLHCSALHYNYLTLHVLHYTIPHYTALHDIALHYATLITPHHDYNRNCACNDTNVNYTTLVTLHVNYSSTTVPLRYATTTATATATVQLQLHHTTSSSFGKATTATIATIPKDTTPTTCRSISGFALPSVIHNNQPLL